MTKTLRDIVPLNELVGKGKLPKLQRFAKADKEASEKITGRKDDYSQETVKHERARALRKWKNRKGKKPDKRDYSKANAQQLGAASRRMRSPDYKSGEAEHKLRTMTYPKNYSHNILKNYGKEHSYGFLHSTRAHNAKEASFYSPTTDPIRQLKDYQKSSLVKKARAKLGLALNSLKK